MWCILVMHSLLILGFWNAGLPASHVGISTFTSPSFKTYRLLSCHSIDVQPYSYSASIVLNGSRAVLALSKPWTAVSVRGCPLFLSSIFMEWRYFTGIQARCLVEPPVYRDWFRKVADLLPAWPISKLTMSLEKDLRKMRLRCLYHLPWAS